MKEFLTFSKPFRTRLLYSVILSALSLCAAMGLLATSAWLISEASTRPPILALEVAIVAVRTFGLSRGVLKYASRIIEHDVALQTQTDLRMRIYESLRRFPTLNLSALRRGQMMQQIIQDVDASGDLWLRIWNPWVSALITGVAGLGIIYALLAPYAYFLGVLFLIAIACAPIIAHISRSSGEMRGHESDLFESIAQSFASVDESLIFGYQEILMDEVQIQQAEIAKIDGRAARWAGVASATYIVALGISLILGILFASTAFHNGKLAGINVAVVILLPLAIFDAISSLPSAFTKLLRVKESINAIEPLLERDRSLPAEFIEVHGMHLEVADVHPMLPGRELPAFSGKASPGEPWIITGASGYGKSSLIFALLGLLPHEGNISIDRERVESLSPLNTTTLLQDDHLFATSIRENLKIGRPEASDQELISILELVELDQLVLSLPQGLDTLIGEAGYNFSGGEKQRIKVARALLRDSDFYLFDEPFEYLGMAQAERISKKLLNFLSKKTVVIVSHLPVKP